MNVTTLCIAALVVVALIAGAGVKGYDLGRDAEKAANVAREAAAREAVEAARKADQDKARQTARNLQTALASQKKLNVELGDSLAKHIQAMPSRPDCVVSDGVYDDLNAALRGSKNAARGGLSGPGGASSPIDAKINGGVDPEAGGGG